MDLPTPSGNESLPFRTGGFSSLAEGLDYAARGETGVNFFSSRGELQQAVPYRVLREQAISLAERLGSVGLQRGDRVAIVAETSPQFLSLFFACQYAGMVPVPLPLCVNFGGHTAYVERLKGMIKSAMARAAFGSEAFRSFLEEAGVGTTVGFVGTVEDIADRPARGSLSPLGHGDPCYIQYSSGSTSFPRGVLVTQEAITANARAISETLSLRSEDRCTSWLPLYHDMGLVGCCLTPVLNQITVDYIETASFARRPFVWLKVLSEQGGTISFSPTFGYELCARRAARGNLEGLDLSRWRVAGIGGEMIRPKALNEFIETFAEARFDGGALVASYGLAEATLAVTFAPLGRGVRSDVVQQGEAFERLRRATPASEAQIEAGARVRAFAICGRPMRGYEVQIRDDLGRALQDRNVGRICIKGPSLMMGYYRNADATRAVIQPDGWLDTGDMGYLIGGDLVVTGRSKDLIIINGRNIWPQDIEWAVEHAIAVRAGDVAAFAVSGEDQGERMVVVVQCRTNEPAAQQELRENVHALVKRVSGTEAEIVLAPPRSLTFTTSGKLSRAAAKHDYVAGIIRDVADIARPEELTVEPLMLAAAG